MFDVMVIGGGPAGVTAALRASELGARVGLVERSALGGICTNDGCVPTRVLARAARLMREARHFAGYGLSGTPPTVDFPGLLAVTRQTVDSIHAKKRLATHLADAGVTLFINAGEARFVDEHTIALEDGRRLRADRFIVAAGGRPRRLDFPGSEHTSAPADVWSWQRMPRSLALIGGGATGCQLASIFNAFGADVWLMDLAPDLLAREDALVSSTLADAFRRRGMQIITGMAGVERVEPAGVPGHLAVHYARQGQADVIEVESVLVASGWPGNADALNVVAAGVRSERGYVVVDDYLRSSTPHIFAAGDITGRMMLVQSANFEGRIAAENAVLGVGQPNRHHIVPHGGFTDPEYAGVGVTEQEACRDAGTCAVAVVPYADLDRAVIDNRAEGFCKLIVSEETHRIVGAHIVGEQALEAIQLVAAAMAADMWVEQLAELELAYPTYTATIGLAARQIVRQLGVMPLAPEWHALGRPHAAEWERSRDLTPLPPRHEVETG